MHRHTKIRKALDTLYPEPRSELDYQSPYQLTIAVILSAQCTDKKVNQVTLDLFSQYEGFAALSKASIDDVEEIIRPINYYRTKSRNIIELARRVTTEHHGKIPLERHLLLDLPGIGNKSANVILGELGIEATFPVDTHVFRVSHRLGLASENTADKVESELKSIFPRESWRNLHHGLIFHGRRVCKAQRPACGACALAELCPSAEIKAPDKAAHPNHALK